MFVVPIVCTCSFLADCNFHWCIVAVHEICPCAWCCRAKRISSLAILIRGRNRDCSDPHATH